MSSSQMREKPEVDLYEVKNPGTPHEEKKTGSENLIF